MNPHRKERFPAAGRAPEAREAVAKQQVILSLLRRRGAELRRVARNGGPYVDVGAGSGRAPDEDGRLADPPAGGGGAEVAGCGGGGW